MQRETHKNEKGPSVSQKPPNNLKNVLSVTAMLMLSKGLDVNPNNLWAQSITSGRKKNGVFVERE